jgi:primosomal protein N' (replication factor Y)
MYFVDVILPLPLPGSYTYSVATPVAPGCRVIVQFGQKKFYSAVVQKCYQAVEQKKGIKEVTSVLDNDPVVLPNQLQFWNWISDYYICHLGEVYKAALPSALKLESETLIKLLPDAVPQKRLTPSEIKIYDFLADGKPVSINDITRKTGIANSIYHVKSLIEKGILSTDEQLDKDFTPKTETLLQLCVCEEEALLQLLNSLSRATKQARLLHSFLHLCGENDRANFLLSSKTLLESSGLSAQVLKSMVDKGIFKLVKREISKNLERVDENILTRVELNVHQQQALQEIKNSFRQKDITLLHGVTSSGKTEVYIQLIREQLEIGKQVLYLLPEIALTTQITERLEAVFGKQLGVYHSKFSDNERAEVWNNLLAQKGYQVILGVRSSVFLPFQNLGLVIVDEEHEASYKQYDPAPRYHGRNAAMVLGSIHGAKILLGTATPSVETYYNALNEKYGLVQLVKRHEDLEMPHIEVVNTKELRRKKIMKSDMFSPLLLEEMEKAFVRKEQVILFRNRRGFAPYLECKSCAWTPKCHHCDVSLTFHKYSNVLTCHYCGATYPVPADCPACNVKDSLSIVGFGTERIEEEIQERFPDKRIARMDLDTTRSKKAYGKIIDGFARGHTDILIGTQMISKGLDFDKVSLVGILQADSLLNQPDFRAHERAFQMLEQVSGRAGRKEKRGLVILQTSNPQNKIISSVKGHDYVGFYQQEIVERETFRYPPFYRIFHVIIRAKDKPHVEEAASLFASVLRNVFKDRVLGPIEPPVGRIQSLYIRRIMIKMENNASTSITRSMLKDCLAYFQSQAISKSISIHFDVDPM